jgi:DNA-binding winged helix-turn-helix (wHTH) protein
VMEGVFLRIEKGDPFNEGERIPLSEGELLIGRIGKENTPDITFSSPYISRRHAIIHLESNQATIMDVKSKHGVQVNGYDLKPNKPYVVRNSDKISLAKGVVLLTFINNNEIELERTMEFTSPFVYKQSGISGLVVQPERRTVLLDGSPVSLSGKHTELLIVLYQNKNQAVSYDELRLKVWPERMMGEHQGIPDVGRDEINALVYRLRKRLGKYGEKIVTVPRYGYMLDI